MKRIFAVIALLAVLAVGGTVALVTCGSGTPLEGTRADVLNAVIDSAGVKDRIDSELRSRATELADSTGIPYSLVDKGINLLDVKEWKVTALPEDATATAHFNVDIQGEPARITAYEDASLVTVQAYGQTLTFEIPESAQMFTQLAPAADKLGAVELLMALQSAQK